jgi:hypothetical protein
LRNPVKSLDIVYISESYLVGSCIQFNSTETFLEAWTHIYKGCYKISSLRQDRSFKLFVTYFLKPPRHMRSYRVGGIPAQTVYILMRSLIELNLTNFTNWKCVHYTRIVSLWTFTFWTLSFGSVFRTPTKTMWKQSEKFQKTKTSVSRKLFLCTFLQKWLYRHDRLETSN